MTKQRTLFDRIIPGNGKAQCYYLGMQAAGFVLVGGLSARMGQDKALLPTDAHPLVSDVAAKVRVAAGNVVLVGSRVQYDELGIDQIPDLRPLLGPLAGIEAALACRRAELNLIVACDMPGLRLSWLNLLLNRAKTALSPCVVVRDASGRVHPLCAVYRHDCLEAVRSALDARHLKLTDLAADLKADLLDVDDPVWNVNTFEEWSAWRECDERLQDAADGAMNAK